MYLETKNSSVARIIFEECGDRYMKKATYADYQEAKKEVLSGGECREYTNIDEYGRIHKVICCEDGNNFYELTENHVTEFWSTKYSKSRKYEEPTGKGTNKMTMRKYLIYMDDGQDCFKVPVPAENKEEALRYVNGNGEVIAVKDITDDFPISSNKVISALKLVGFSQTEIMLMIRTLEFTDICDSLY